MAAAGTADFLVEIGTEELPPKALKDLMAAFIRNVGEGLERERLRHDAISGFATPRRLAVLVRKLAMAQPDRELEQKGPPVSVAFDAGGKAKPAALAFAGKCGVPVEALQITRTRKGEWVSCRTVEQGRPAADLLSGIVTAALEKLPVPRRMRWGSVHHEFVRPVHWLLMLHGESVLDGDILGVSAGRVTFGHRFMAPGEQRLARPADYPGVLERAFVVADFEARRERVVEGVRVAAAEVGGRPLGDAVLYDEVTALTEWPVALTGRFEAAFLRLPREVIVATLTGHQRYFPLVDEAGKLLANFVTVANLESKDPARVRDGNERVIRPRLADAAFFWDQDLKTPLDARRSALADVVYQKGLGSIGDRSARIAQLGAVIAAELGIEAAPVERAAELGKCDLLTGMVGEFPELQGIVGGYYARASGELPVVADAIREQYQPRFAGDGLPATPSGQALAIADKLDTLAGGFALGRRPGGNRDPFGLRRAALGLVRIVIEKHLDLDMPRLLELALSSQPARGGESLQNQLYDFILERMRGYYVDAQGLAPEVFEAVRVKRPNSLADFDSRIRAVTAFLELDAAASLAAANKRIANILRQAGDDGFEAVDANMLEEPAEKSLHRAVLSAEREVAPLRNRRAYTEVLTTLSNLRPAIDAFFDQVMVLTDDEALRDNRLALLSAVAALFLDIADISRLSTG